MARPAMLVVKTPAREGNRSKPFIQQVAPTVRTTPADRHFAKVTGLGVLTIGEAQTMRTAGDLEGGGHYWVA